MAFSVGDLVILKSGSMRMVVEAVDDDGVISTVWCNDGAIGRDNFASQLLVKAEERGERPHHGGASNGRGGPHGGDRGGDRWDRGDRGDRGGDRGDRGGDRGDRGGDRGGYRTRDRDDGPPRKQGWDGKPRDKKYFRKDD